ncbi:hypothetical protein [Undibacterium sp. Ren11W]|uniref:hypothetical protein n=1 Tax=Undibacterium sp. Ren11W TaxID=3413045 RepID=UPI003BEF8AAF
MDLATQDAIAQSGILAPSADNGLRYYFEYQDHAIVIWADQEFVSNPERHRRVLDLLAYGAAVENMLLRASELGFSAKLSWFPSDDPLLIARLDFQANSGILPDVLAHAIPDRQTNRQVFYKGAPSDAQRTRISVELEKIPGVRLIWLEGAERKLALKLIWLAESARFQSQRLHQELFSSIRFDLNWRENADFGLPPASLEVESLMRPMFKALRHWPLMRALNLIGLHRVMGMRAAYLPCVQAPALALVCSSLQLDQAALAVGRGFERAWLCATLERLALQPMAASVVLPLQNDADQGISSKARSQLAAGWEEICRGDTPLMIFRLGSMDSTAAPTLKTGRKPLSSYRLSR